MSILRVLLLATAAVGTEGCSDGLYLSTKYNLAAAPLIPVPCKVLADKSDPGQAHPIACSIGESPTAPAPRTVKYVVPDVTGAAPPTAADLAQVIYGLLKLESGVLSEATVSAGIRIEGGTLLIPWQTNGTNIMITPESGEAGVAAKEDFNIVQGNPATVVIAGTIQPNDTITVVVTTPPPQGQLTPMQSVNYMVQDSQDKCATFVNAMFAETAGLNTSLDLLGTTSSALATVFTPLAATHAFSAAGTIFGGAKTSFSANYLNSLTISHITQSIQSTYGDDIKTYLQYLDTADPDKIDAYAERSKIESYHTLCSLSAAEGTISSTLEPSGSSPTSAPVTLTYKVQAADSSFAKLGKDLVDAIGKDSSLTSAGISAKQPSATVASISITAPAGTKVTAEASSTAEKFPVADESTIAISGSGAKPRPAVGDTITLTFTLPASKSSGSDTTPAQATCPKPAAGSPGADLKNKNAKC